jgi:hypothetical protein
MLEERPNYLSVLSTENGIIKLLVYEIIIKKHMTKMEKYYRGMSDSLTCYFSRSCEVCGIYLPLKFYNLM